MSNKKYKSKDFKAERIEATLSVQLGTKRESIVSHLVKPELKISRQEQASRLIGRMSRLWCHDLTAILLVLILIIEKNFFRSLETSQFTYCKMIMYMIGSLDSLNSDCRSFSDFKTVAGSGPKSFQVSYAGVSLS